MNSKINKIILILLFFVLLAGCKTTKKNYDDYDIPSDIIFLMRNIQGFSMERGFFDITTISGWFVEDDGSEYGLIDAELVNFEWEDYQGTQKRSLFRDWDNTRKYADYKDWLTHLNRRQNLVSVNINPNTQNAMLLLSRHLNFPVKFSYSLEFDDEIIYSFENNESMGSEIIGADLIEEAGIYRVRYSIDGFESTTTFSIRR